MFPQVISGSSGWGSLTCTHKRALLFCAHHAVSYLGNISRPRSMLSVSVPTTTVVTSEACFLAPLRERQWSCVLRTPTWLCTTQRRGKWKMLLIFIQHPSVPSEPAAVLLGPWSHWVLEHSSFSFCLRPLVTVQVGAHGAGLGATGILLSSPHPFPISLSNVLFDVFLPPLRQTHAIKHLLNEFL